MRRGEVWKVAEGAFPGSSAPVACVIVGSDAVQILPLRVVVPLLARKETHERAPWMVKVEAMPGMAAENAFTADALQVRSIPTELLEEKIGTAPADVFHSILKALRVVLDIEE